MPGTLLLLIEPDAQTAAQLSTVLERAGYRVSVAPSGKEGLINAWRDQPDGIILELALPDLPASDLLGKLRQDRRTMRTPIFGLTRLRDPAAIAAAMEAGLNQCIIKDANALELLLSGLSSAGLSTRQRVDAAGRVRQGSLAAVVAAKGGVGASSLCANLAHLIAKASGEGSTALVDLALPMGSLHQLMGVSSPHGWPDLSHEDVLEALHSLIDDLPIPKPWAAWLLPGARRPEESERLSKIDLGALLQGLRTHFAHVWLDLGRGLGPPAMLAFTQANLVLIIFPPDPDGVASTRAIRDYLIGEGVAASRIHLISNRTLPAESLTATSLGKALGQEVLAALPYMEDRFSLANVLRAPLDLRFPEERVTLALQELATRILEMLAPAGAPTSP